MIISIFDQLSMQKTLIQKIALIYFVLFFLIVALNYVPAIHDEQGQMFGLFHLDLIDDLLHFGSAVWALIAGWYSIKAATFYFKWFGAAYLLDGILGILVGKGYLDLAIFMPGPAVTDLGTKIALNVPHILIGGSAVIIGVVLIRMEFWQRTTFYANPKANIQK